MPPKDVCIYGKAHSVDPNQTIPSVAKIYMYLSKTMDNCIYGKAHSVDPNQTIPSVAKIYMYLSKTMNN